MFNRIKRIRVSPGQRALFKRVQYFLMRHPVALDAADRKALRSGPRVLANSFPKAGTNLLTAVLAQHPAFARDWRYHLDEGYGAFWRQLQSQRPGQLISLHSKWRPEWADYLRSTDQKMLFIMRDLRDIAVSNFHYLLRDKSHRLHRYFASLGDDRARLMASISGVPSEVLGGARASLSLREHAAGYQGWLDSPHCHCVKFEDIIGEFGGGSRNRQVQAVGGLFHHIGLAVSAEEVEAICGKAISPKARTFRKGQIGDWRNHVDDELKAVLKEEIGEQLIAYRYEVDFEW